MCPKPTLGELDFLRCKVLVSDHKIVSTVIGKVVNVIYQIPRLGKILNDCKLGLLRPTPKTEVLTRPKSQDLN